MDCVEVKGESPVDEQLEPLFILEEGDEPEEFTNKAARGKGTLRVRQAEEHEDTVTGAKVDDCEHEDRSIIKVKEETGAKLEDQKNKEAVESQVEVVEELTRTEERLLDRTLEASEENAVQAGGGLTIVEKAEGEKMEGQHQKTEEDAALSPEIQTQAKLRPKDLLKPEDALLKVHRLSHDFPDTLYELLCTLQEGRRLNDQRCSFRLEGRRRCYSEPSTPRHSQKVMFSSMTSLQKEEFFDLLATSQGRRLDDQRADFQSPSPVPSSPEPPKPSSSSTASNSTALSAIPQAKFKLRKGSCKGPESSQTVPRPVPKEDLYNMILTSQAQGRLEEQRSVAPGPMDDEDFFSLLLKVQGGRMDEQRTEMPIQLKY